MAAQLGDLCLLEGREEEGLRAVEEGRDLAHRTGDLYMLQMVVNPLIEHALLKGDRRTARTHFERLRAAYPQGEQPEEPRLLELEAFLALEEGDLAHAGELVGQYFDQVSRADFSGVRPYLIKAAVLARQDRWDEAAQLFDETLARMQQTGDRQAAAEVLDWWGRLLAEKGAAVPARERLEAALVIFRQMGARPYADRAARILASLPPS